MIRALRLYAQTLGDRRVAPVAVLLLAAVAALMESSALVMLVPMVQIGIDGAAAADGGSSALAVTALVAAIRWLGVGLTLPNLLMLFVVVAAGSVSLVWLANVLIHRQIAHTDAYMRHRLFTAAMELDWPVLARENSAEIIKSLTSDPVQAGLGLFNMLMAGTALFAVLVYLVVASLLSFQLTLLTVVFGAALAPVYRRLVDRGRIASEDASERERETTNETAQAIGNAKLLFGQGLRERMVAHYGREVGGFRDAKVRHTTLVESSRLIFELMAVGFVTLILIMLTLVEQWPVAQGLVFVAIFYRLAPKVVNVQGCLFRAVGHAAWVSDWAARLERYAGARRAAHDGPAPRFEREIALDSVSYSYPDGDEPALAEVSLTLRPGEAIAVVGPSGHGKSTLIDVLTGLLQPQRGRVLIDGVNLNVLDTRAWQNMIGWVPQEAPLFHGTIRENILLFDAGPADDARLDHACAVADAAGFVAALPDGFETMVGERGVRLSGGQRQRIALARALYRRPKLLILDEVTSALDKASAERVVDNLLRHRGDMAIVAVTHSDALLSLADRTYSMDRGRLGPFVAAEPGRGRAEP